VRLTDTGCHRGGGDFIVILPDADLIDCLSVAERIRLSVSKIRPPRGRARTDVLTYGIAAYPGDGRTSDVLMESSDRRFSATRLGEMYPQVRQYPRFAVKGVQLRLRGLAQGDIAADVKDIGHGGLSLILAGQRLPHRVDGEIVQRLSPRTHAVTVRPVSTVALRRGRTRVGCTYV
jgi:hypothetical protein